jgi:hypothetical protein
MTRARGLLFLVLRVCLTEVTSAEAAAACRHVAISVILQDSTSMSNRKRHNREHDDFYVVSLSSPSERRYAQVMVLDELGSLYTEVHGGVMEGAICVSQA